MKSEELSKGMVTNMGKIMYFIDDDETGKTAVIYNKQYKTWLQIPISEITKKDIVREAQKK